MAKPDTAEVRAWSPRDRTLSVYVDETLELIIEQLKESIPLRSKAEVGRQAIDLGLRQMPGYAEAVKAANRMIVEREAAASRDVVA